MGDPRPDLPGMPPGWTVRNYWRRSGFVQAEDSLGRHFMELTREGDLRANIARMSVLSVTAVLAHLRALSTREATTPIKDGV